MERQGGLDGALQLTPMLVIRLQWCARAEAGAGVCGGWVDWTLPEWETGRVDRASLSRHVAHAGHVA